MGMRNWMRKWGLREKLISLGVLLTLLPLLIIAGMTWREQEGMRQTVSEKSEEVAFADLQRVLHLYLETMRGYNEKLKSDNERFLGIAHYVLEEAGGCRESGDAGLVEWEARNQFTGDVETVKLARMVSGSGDWFGQEKKVASEVPVIDTIHRITGASVTLFQRMNEGGDLLRVATTIQKKDGTRAIGTYIPAVNPDGTANAVVQTVMRGGTYVGRAFVVNEWFQTAYAPLRDDSGQVFAVLFVGIADTEAYEKLKQLAYDTVVGRTGYLFALNAKGANRGRYVISYRGERNGENILDVRDSEGRPFIRELTEEAVGLEPGETRTVRYPWKNAGDEEARMKVVKYSYFEPWDWVVAIGSYEDEFYETAVFLDTRLGAVIRMMLLVTAVAGLLASVVWLFVAGRISSVLKRIIVALEASARETASAAAQIAESSRSVASGSSEQAAAVQETAASMEELSNMAKSTRENSHIAGRSATLANEQTGNCMNKMKEMQSAMNAIKESSGSIQKIIKVIDEIAFQTNILALNAAVEAARAGEAGAGFSVVAEEVRHLAQRCAGAARETSEEISESIQRSENGADLSDLVAGKLHEIAEVIHKVESSVSEIVTSVDEQAGGFKQIAEAMNQVEEVTQSSASSAEEGAAASTQLGAQVDALHDAVVDLAELVQGSRAGARHRTAEGGGALGEGERAGRFLSA